MNKNAKSIVINNNNTITIQKRNAYGKSEYIHLTLDESKEIRDELDDAIDHIHLNKEKEINNG